MSLIAQDLDLTSDDNVALVRQAILAPMIASRDYESAIEVLDAILAAQPHRIRERSEIASYYLRIGNQAEATAQIQTAISHEPENSAICAQAIQISLHFKDSECAAEMAASFLPECLGDPRLAELSTTALYRAGRIEEAVEAARVSISLNQDELTIVARAAGVLTAAGYASEAARALSDADVLLSVDAPALFEYGRAKFQVNKQDLVALEVLQLAFELAPENGRVADLLLRALLANGKGKAAVDVVERSGVSVSKSPSFKLQFARALRSSRRYGEAADIMTELSKADPDNSVLRRQYASALALAGRTEQALATYQQDLDIRGAQLPETLAVALQNIAGRLDEAKIPAIRFEWAYQRLEELGVAPQDTAAWEDRVRWINLADHVLLDWMECRTEQSDQVESLIDGIEAATTKITDVVAPGEGTFIVTSHIGALFAGPAALAASGLDPIWVASTPVIETGLAAGRILSTSSMDEISLARAIMTAVGSGRVVSIAIDGAGVPNLPQHTLFNRQVGLSDFVPRTCFRTGIKSFFPRLVWDGGRIKADMIAMPMPNTGETRDAYVNRWLEFFVNEVKEIFTQSPDNLRMSGGFWSGIST